MDRLPRTRRFRRQVALLAVGLFVIAAISWSRFRTVPERDSSPARTIAEGTLPSARHEGFVGSRACAECHREIAEAYSRHPMANSLRLIEDPVAFLRGRPANAVSGELWTYNVSTMDDELIHSESVTTPDEDEIYSLPVAMKYIVGSGERAEAFLQQRGGLLLMSPLNWYAGCRCWDLAPGYSRHDTRRFDRRVTDECLSCHAGRVAESGHGSNLYADAPFHEMAIGCERCHGPGEQHIAAARSGDSHGLASAIVQPARLEGTRRDAVCYQCHLQTASRVPRAGKSEFSFHPGMDVTENWVFLDEADPAIGKGERSDRFVSQVQQMESSRCYLDSGGRLGCTSCHDPHRTPEKGKTAAYYRDRCRTCHDGTRDCVAPLPLRQQQDDSCIACHMPKQETTNAVHVSQSDHRVRRHPQVAVAEDPAEDGMPTLRFFRNMDRQLSPAEQQRALGLGVGKFLSKKGIRPPEALLTALQNSLRENPDDGEAWLALGSMALQLGRRDLADESYRRALAIPRMEERALSGLLDIRAGEENWLEVERDSARSLEIDPGDVRAASLRAVALDRLGRHSEARAAAERALALHPSDQALRRWLTEAYRRAGLRSEADRHQQIFDRIADVLRAGQPKP